MARLAAGEGAFFNGLKSAERPAIIIGMGALARDDGGAIMYEGTVSTTGLRLRVAELIQIRDGLIASISALMAPKEANPFADA